MTTVAQPVTGIRKVTFGEACRLALEEALQADPGVFLLGEDIGDAETGGTFKVTKGLSTRFGTDRVRTTPISEQAIIGAAMARPSPGCGRWPRSC
jgi:pyruvate/2-oxoglutarate/acetoin dehydrogenase E1 component